MKTYYLNKISSQKRESLLKRPAINMQEVNKAVKPIVEGIKKEGLAKALFYARKYEDFTGKDIFVSREEFDAAEKNLDPEVKKAIKTAAKNIEKFHAKQKPKSYLVTTSEGVVCSREYRAITDAGLYIPGGSAVLPSTMLMLGIPAMIAGCQRVTAASPQGKNGISNALLYAARLTGVTEFIRIGGAQAVALMAYGGGPFRRVHKIFGPGNQYVTAAKMMVSIDPEGCAIDMPAGPSEVLVIADANSNPEFIAADLLSQAEHGSDSQVVFLTISEKIAAKVEKEVAKQLAFLPRKATAAKALRNSFTLITGDIADAVEFSNDYAPEHLIIHLKNAEKYVPQIINAGSVFLGEYSPESAGDYASGTNHSLPTYGYARSFGGVSVESFMKTVTFQKLSRKGLKTIAQAVETLAETEGLHAHKNAVSVRMKK